MIEMNFDVSKLRTKVHAKSVHNLLITQSVNRSCQTFPSVLTKQQIGSSNSFICGSDQTACFLSDNSILAEIAKNLKVQSKESKMCSSKLPMDVESLSTCPHQQILKLTFVELSSLITSMDIVQKRLKDAMENSGYLGKCPRSIQQPDLLLNHKLMDKVTEFSRYSTVESRTVFQTNIFGFQILRTSLSTFFSICSWFSRRFCMKLVQVASYMKFDTASRTSSPCKSCSDIHQLVEEVNLNIDRMGKNNDNVTFEADQKYRLLSEELLQIRLKNNSQLDHLTQKLETTSSDNEKLRAELNDLKRAFETMKNNPPVRKCAPPPPPPPPPPPFLLKPDVTHRTPKAKKQNPANSVPRPTITVEALMSVNLKKTPTQIRPPKKDDNVFVISTDMLRSVKLRPTKLLTAELARSPSR